MPVNPVIRACDNPYTKWWWNGWLVGVLTGVAVATLVVLVSRWGGAQWI